MGLVSERCWMQQSSQTLEASLLEERTVTSQERGAHDLPGRYWWPKQQTMETMWLGKGLERVEDLPRDTGR